MMDFDFVQQLIRAVDDSSIDNVEVERGGTRIRISKTPSGAILSSGAVTLPPAGGQAPAAPAQTSSNPHGGTEAATRPAMEDAAPAPVDHGWDDVTSPMVGTFYRSPAPDADAFTEVGKRIAPGDTLCIIEAMKLMNELEAEIEGTIREICVEDGDPVEYGQVLFRVEPA